MWLGSSQMSAVAATNEWVGSGADVNASNTNNWSLLHVPTIDETVLLGATSVADMTWNLTNAVAGWVQSAGYSGTVTVPVSEQCCSKSMAT